MRRPSIEWAFLLPLAAFLGLFEFYPLLSVAYHSLLENGDRVGIVNYTNIFTMPQYAEALRDSLLFSAVCAIVGIIGGTAVGYFSRALGPAGKNVLLSIYSLPLTLSGLVVAFAFIVLLGRDGLLNLILQHLVGLPRGGGFDLYSWGGLVVVYSFFQVPLMTLTMAPVFENLDWSLVEAARNLGATTIQRWRFVIAPAIAPGLIAGASIQFAGMMGAYGTVLAITGMSHNLLSLQIYSNASEATFNLPQSDALSIALVLVTAVALLLFERSERRIRPGSGQ